MAEAVPVAQALALAVERHRAGALAEAERLYRDVLRRAPQHPAASRLLGALVLRAGRPEEALVLLQDAVALAPRDADARNDLGLALRRLGRPDAAAESCRGALALAPDHPQAWLNLGNALNDVGSTAEALACYRRAVALRPAWADAHRNLGLALQAVGDPVEAAAHLHRALALGAETAASRNALGAALQACGRNDEAIGQYRRALALDGGLAAAHHNLGTALAATGRSAEAIACQRRALAAAPEHAGARAQLAHLLRGVCDWDAAAAEDRRVLALVRAGAAKVPPFVLVAAGAPPADQLRCARQWASRFPTGLGPDHRKRGSGARLRLGYLSADLHAHATAVLAAELFERHDRARFEVVAYSCGPDDGSDMRRRLVAGFDRFVDLRGVSDRQAAERIRADGVDILIDLKGHTRNARSGIVALRPAPVQAAWLGYPGTMGADFVDYVIGDRFVTPMDDQPLFAERIVQLPDSYQPNDTRRAVGEPPSRAACGLPEDGFVFCAFHAAWKTAPAVFAVWMRLLEAVPGSVLWLLRPEDPGPANLLRAAAGHGVAPERIVFAPRLDTAAHLARHRRADLFLDTLPYNGHTTVSDALWAGLPVVTCRGESFAGRVGTSLLHAAGLPELAVGALAEYEALALGLAADPGRLAGLRARLAAARAAAPLFDAGRFAAGLESAFETMWRRHADGLPPKGFAVAP